VELRSTSFGAHVRDILREKGLEPRHLEFEFTETAFMQDPLQYIDLDYYRSAQLLIARAEIAQLRRPASALARTEQLGKISTGASCPVDDQIPSISIPR
jgi:predicted signal transduction protein with EAL and GGDEF domain